MNLLFMTFFFVNTPCIVVNKIHLSGLITQAMITFVAEFHALI